METTEAPPQKIEYSYAEVVAMLPAGERDAFYAGLTQDEARVLQYEWRNWWARPKQILPIENTDWVTWMILSGRGFGKALSLDTKIPTVDGWTSMGDIQVGDKVFDEQGAICEVTYVAPIQYKKKCYRVVFSDGTEVVADGEHEWLTIDRRTRKALARRVKPEDRTKFIEPKYAPSTVTTETIFETLYDANEVNHAIPNTKPLQLPDINLPIAPYVLGAWLGDGSSSGAEITCVDRDNQIIEEIEECGYASVLYQQKSNKSPRYGIGMEEPIRDEKTGQMLPNGSLKSVLGDLNLLHNKHIPTVYLRASYQQRLALLQGLMDTDGHITPKGYCEFTTIRKELVEQVYDLIVSLGIKGVIYEGRATLNGVDHGAKYRICFTPYIPVFRLVRKLERVKRKGNQHKRQLRRYIVEVEPVESVPVRCIGVNSPSHLFLCSESMIPTHNTRSGAEAVRELVTERGYRRIGLIGRTAADARDVMVEGESGLLSVFPPWQKPNYEPSKRRVTFHNGAIATTYSGDKPDQLRGPQHDAVWADELAAWRYPEAWDMAKFGNRLGQRPIEIVTSTPRPTKLIRELYASASVFVTHGTTYENMRNLPASVLAYFKQKYEGTRLGQQELLARILTDVPGALWTNGLIELYRVAVCPPLVRIVVAIDPAVSAEEDSSETGIVVVGLGADQHGYVLEDVTIRGRPSEWAKVAVKVYRDYNADRIIAEVNNGGDMVEATVRTEDDKVSFKQVRASRGKVTRAEPVSALYETGMVHHVGVLAELEDQMCTWVQGDKSPDRLDAMVWGLTELMLDNEVPVYRRGKARL